MEIYLRKHLCRLFKEPKKNVHKYCTNPARLFDAYVSVLIVYQKLDGTKQAVCINRDPEDFERLLRLPYSNTFLQIDIPSRTN